MANLSEVLSSRDAEALRRRLQQGVELGVLRHGCAPQYAIWRFEDAAGKAFLTCYGFNRKRGGHAVLMQGDAARLQLVRDGAWEALRERALPRDNGFVGPRATLERLPKLGGAAEHATPPPRVSDLSRDQRTVYDALVTFARAPRGELTLGGLAGTGKSTVIALFARELARRVAFCAPTGKAALGLAQKLSAAGVDLDRHFCGTLHRLIYRPTFDPETGRLLRVERAPELPYDLLVVDEASMVGRRVYEDIAQYRRPALFVGDHGQLQPIAGPGEPPFSLLARPMLTLERVHRQVEGSPILALATHVRRGGDPATFRCDGRTVRRVAARTAEELFERAPELAEGPAEESVVLTHTNRARVAHNRALRHALGRADEAHLAAGDVVVCLRNSYFVAGDDHVLVANGARGVVDAVHEEREHHLLVTILHADEGARVKGEVLLQQLDREKTLDSYEDLPFDVFGWGGVGLLYDHGLAVTVHKAQGSQFRRTVVVLEPSARRDPRWLYTAVTRATHELVLVDPERR